MLSHQYQNSRSLMKPSLKMASLVTQTVKNPPAMWETWVRSLGQEDALEEGIAIHSSILAWRITWTEVWWAIVHGGALSWTRLSDEHTHKHTYV